MLNEKRLKCAKWHREARAHPLITIEDIIEQVQQEAKLKYEKKKKPTSDEFKELVICLASEKALYYKSVISEKSEKEAEEFFACFNKSKDNLRNGSDKSLEKIIEKSFKEL